MDQRVGLHVDDIFYDDALSQISNIESKRSFKFSWAR